MLKKWNSYVHSRVWQVQIATLPKWKAFRLRLLRIVLLTSQGFTKSQVQQGASSLTYYTLLAIVPILALLFAIARGFQLEKIFEEWLLGSFDGQQIIVQRIIQFAENSLQQVQGGWIAVFGVLLFFWSGIKILIYIERVMNQVWEVKNSRSFAKCFSDYLAMLFLCPLIIVLASGLTVYISSAIAELGKHGKILEEISPFLLPVLNLIPYLLTFILFTFLYVFIPNTRVRFLPALWAGFLTGIAFQIAQAIYLYFQIGVAKYNVIYGTLATLPLFLIWLHLSWVIILLGAKVAFSIQNVDAYEFITEEVHLSHKFKMILSLRIVHYCIKKFCKEEPPPLPIELSNSLSIPLSLTSHLLYQLVEARILSEVRSGDVEVGFQPAIAPEKLTIKHVIDMINARGEEITLPPSHELNLILKSLDKFNEMIEKCDENILLKDV